METKKTHIAFGFGNPPMFKTLISLDRVYFLYDDGTEEKAEEWFKRIIKETLADEKEK